MPITPFHLGVGVLVKATCRRHFSFLIFSWSQVLMDIEPLIRLVRHKAVVHGPSHTLVGALVVGLTSAAVGKPITQVVLRMVRRPCAIAWPVALCSALVGTYSHIILDAMMHRDMRPLWPISSTNPLLELLSIEWLHFLCVLAGVVGLGMLRSSQNTPQE